MLDAVPQRPIGVVPADLLELYFEIKPSGTDSSAWLLIREELVKRGHPPRTWTAIKEKKGELESRGRRELGSCLNLEQSFVPGGTAMTRAALLLMDPGQLQACLMTVHKWVESAL